MELQLIIVSLIAGILTILAPCVFPLLPILVGSTSDGGVNKKKAFRVIGSLLASIALITLLIQGSSSLLNLDDGALRIISASIIAIVGLVTFLPNIWEKVSLKLGIGQSSNKLLGKAMKRGGPAGDILIGAALGPVFSSCSPTYGLIVGTILPVSFIEGTFYLMWYIFGLGLMFVLLALLGGVLVKKMAWATDPNGWFKRVIGVIFLLIAISIFFNLDKSFETWLLQFGFYESLISFELRLR